MDAAKPASLEGIYSFVVSIPPSTPAEFSEALVEDIKLRFVDDGFAGIYEEVNVDTLETIACTVYLDSLEQAIRCSAWVQANTSLKCSDPEKQENKDWNEAWNQAFQGIEIENLWKIMPSSQTTAPLSRTDWPKVIVLTMGAGFGTGTHETTRLCLEALAMFGTLESKKVLDFGSGSGILSIAASLMDAAQVDAVEIDELAIQNAMENVRLNSVEVTQVPSLSSIGDRAYDVVVANILAPVLLAHASELSAKLAPEGVLILSGLLHGDVDEIIAIYQHEIGVSHRAEVTVLNDWARVTFKPIS